MGSSDTDGRRQELTEAGETGAVTDHISEAENFLVGRIESRGKPFAPLASQH